MRIAFCVYDGMTMLDFVGAYDPLTRIDRMGFRDIEWDVCAKTDSVLANRLELGVDQVEPDLGGYDLVFIPGGVPARELRNDESFISWLRTADADDYITSVCTGSLLLGEAGFLEGKRATTHPTAYDVLETYATVVDDRVVHDGNVITGRGVSSSLDLGLYLVSELTDEQTRAAIAEQMDYPYGQDVSGATEKP